MRNGLAFLFVLSLAPMTSARAQGAALDPVPGTTAALVQLAGGTVPDALGRIEAALRTGEGLLGRGSAERAITELGFGLRGTGPALVATAADPLMQLLVYRAARDTQGVRRTVEAIDVARRRVSSRNVPPPLALAEALLWLGDSSAALAHLVEFERNAATMDGSVVWGMVRNDWLTARTLRLLADLRAARPAAADTSRYLLVSRPAAQSHYRYDAAMWARLPMEMVGDTGRTIARITVHTTEEARTALEGGTLVRQRFDAVALDFPVRGLLLGLDDLDLRRQVRDAARDLSAETMLDGRGRVTRHAVRSAAPLPDELRGALEDGTGFLPLAAAIALPAAPMAVGDTWTDSIGLWAPGGVFDRDAKVLATYRLERVMASGGEQLAFISMSAQYRGAMNARLSGEAVLSLTSGEYLRMAGSLRARVAGAGGFTEIQVLLTALRESAPAAVAVASATPGR